MCLFKNLSWCPMILCYNDILFSECLYGENVEMHWSLFCFILIIAYYGCLQLLSGHLKFKIFQDPQLQ